MGTKLLPLFIFILLSTSLFGQPPEFDATIVEYTGLRYPCEVGLDPVLKIQNTGATTMLSCVVETWKNGLMLNTLDWELAVPAESDQIRQPVLPHVADVEFGDVLEFRIISVNNEPDQVLEGNILSVTMDDAPVYAADNVVTVGVHTGMAVQDVTWDIKDATGQVVSSGGPYGTTLTLHETTVSLEPVACYQIVFNGVDENGIPMGSLTLSSADETIYFQPGELMVPPVYKGFITGTVMEITERNSSTGFMISPNPTKGNVNVIHGTPGTFPVVLEVFDTAGRSLTVINVTQERSDLDLSGYGSGSYLLVLQTANGDRHAQRVVVY